MLNKFLILSIGLFSISSFAIEPTFCKSQNLKSSQECEINYLTVGSVKLESISELSPLMNQQIQLPGGGDLLGKINETSVILDAIINVGQKIWTIIEKGQPVVSVQSYSASAMPTGISKWNQLSGWQPTQSQSFKIIYKNLFGMEVVNFTYRVLFNYGGSFNGKGRYISGATIIPANVSVAWGYTFNSSVTIPTVNNAGTTENPVGGIQMNVNWEVETKLKNIKSVSSFYVNGLGRLVNLN